MRNQDSTITAEQSQQINNPQIRITTLGGYYANELGFFGTSSLSFQNGTGIEFNNRYILSDFAGSTMYLHSYTTAGTGSTLYPVGNAGAGLQRDGSFLQVGNTMRFYFRYQSGATVRIGMVASGNGQTWGGSQGVHTFGGASSVSNILVTTQNQIYYGEAGPSSIVVIKSITNSGSWGITTLLDSGLYTITAGTGDKVITGYNYDTNRDVLFINASTTQNVSNVIDNSRGIRMYQSDGTNIYGWEEIINTQDSQYIIKQTNYSKGSTMHYLGIVYQYEPSNIVESNNGGIAFMESEDGLNWSHPINIRVGFVEPTINASTPNIPIIAGISSNVLNVFGLSMWIAINTGITPMDISDRIISYSNTNNESINLIVGNYE